MKSGVRFRESRSRELGLKLRKRRVALETLFPTVARAITSKLSALSGTLQGTRKAARELSFNKYANSSYRHCRLHGAWFCRLVGRNAEFFSKRHPFPFNCAEPAIKVRNELLGSRSVEPFFPPLCNKLTLPPQSLLSSSHALLEAFEPSKSVVSISRSSSAASLGFLLPNLRSPISDPHQHRV